MKRNVKILAGALITAMTAASIGVSFADSSSTGTLNLNKKVERQALTTEQKAEMDAMKLIMEKKRAGETLTTDEQAKLDAFEATKPNFGSMGEGMKRGEGMKSGERGERGEKGGFMNNLTTEEKTALQSMTTEEKKAFFEAKKAEQIAKRDAREGVIDKLLAGQTLTADEEVVRAEIIKERADRKAEMLNDNK
ncbi:MAG: hypothetical protein PHV23_00600 [Candidatus Gracilibacteria bacterium]|nr:hypothetical protein [Candidatus Gracilibacteria bacterium]